MKHKFIFLVAGMIFLSTAGYAFAGDPVNPGTAWVLLILNNLINIVLWPILVGAVIIMIIFSGFMFATSAGDPGKMKMARDALVWAIIGIIIAIFAFSAYGIISRVIVSPVSTVVTPPPSPPPPPVGALLNNGDPCTSHAVCSSSWCNFGECSGPLLQVGDPCLLNASCISNRCNTFTNTCQL